jgi:guanylate kinase
MANGRLVVVSGPSGAGKTSVMRRVYQQCRVPLVRSVSATTRPPREDERNGVDYYFLSRREFKSRQKKGDFLESFEVFDHGYWYGTLWSQITSGLADGNWVVLEIDVHGARAVAARFTNTITIFLRPSTREELERRLRSRATETEEAIQRRLGEADAELACAGWYRYRVINDNMDQAVQEICDILASEWETSQDD